MALEGRTCGMCNRGKLHKTQDEAAPGVFVEAYSCDRCGEIAYSKEVMEKVEALYRDKAEVRSLIKVGASLVVSIPKQIVQKLRLRPKEKVYVSARGNEIVVRVAPA